MTHRNRLSLLALAALAAAACGDDSTGPDARGIAGNYTYTFANLTNGQGVSCAGTLTMPLTQNGGAFSGTYTGSVTCASTVGSSGTEVTGKVVNGRMAGDSVFFDLDDSGWRNSGLLEGTTIRGVVNVNGQGSDGSAIALTGTFTCVKR